MIEVTQEDRLLVADILDEVSDLLDHTGIGQVADLIRDGEYDEHDCVVIATRHRIAAENAALERAAKVAIEALTEAREALHFHYTEAREALPFYYVEWGGEPEDAVQLQLARSKCDEAIRALKGPSNG